ncbi:MAG: ATP-binding protein [Candidatus Freyarchaeota archaeon]|nr:ATP-binding protein [Candidatus Jordarchaeia archaeon]MBS7269276.1 ATP-binding protein [Candidatus Jordarchaeia archaeon]MBS7280786.1 ATP-binding protein [Candidatus Jordarchaeia archaeon]
MDVVGQIVAGEVSSILIREKSGERMELGDLLVVDDKDGYLILKVFNLLYGSQVPQAARELLAGMELEGHGGAVDFLEPELRSYVLAEVKAIAKVTGKNELYAPKTLPAFFKSVKLISEKNLSFLTKPPCPVYLGKVRSGSKVLDVDVFLNGRDIFTHHVLVAATTGRGKSNLVKVMLWSIVGEDNFGVLVLDPHDEYYGRHANAKGLKGHPKAKDNIFYFSPNPIPGTHTLMVNLKSIKPSHFEGIIDFTDPQWDAIKIYYNLYGENWIESIVRGEEASGIAPRTLDVLQRKFNNALGVYMDASGSLQCRNRTFSDTAGESTINEIINILERGKMVILDTSRLLDQAELLLGSIVIEGIFNRYQQYKSTGELDDKPVVTLVIEEAPRVLGTEVLSSMGENIYATVAREGRKFKVGLIAITQLTSVIPRTILANMNTKIIMGNEVAPERRAIIDSAAQDLSDEDREIASLDKGEAIISSNFTKFAIPIRVPLFEEYIKKFEETQTKKKEESTVFIG